MSHVPKYFIPYIVNLRIKEDINEEFKKINKNLDKYIKLVDKVDGHLNNTLFLPLELSAQAGG